MSTSRATWRRRSRSSSALALLALTLLISGAARAGGDRRVSLAFDRTHGYDTDVWIADADGSNATKLVRTAFNPLLSPDGRRLAYFVPRRPNALPVLWVKTFPGQLTRRIDAAMGVSWGPQSRRLVYSTRQRILLADLDSGKRRLLVHGHVCCASFAPDGRAVVFGKSNGSFGRNYRSDVYVIRLTDGRISRLTRDHHSDSPVWGRGWIAYSHTRVRGGWLIRDVRLMRSDGSGKRLLAHLPKPESGEMGIEAVAFSRDGSRLLGCLSSEFQCPPVVFDVPDGRRYSPRVGRRNELTVAVAISADGSEALVEAGGIEGPWRALAVPLDRGKARELARNADHASWSR